MDIEDASVMLLPAPTGVGEDVMIQEHVCAAVRALFERGLSKSAIGERLGLDRKTVRKYLATEWGPQHPYLAFGIACGVVSSAECMSSISILRNRF